MMRLGRGMVSVALLPGVALAGAPQVDRADNGFMMLATALVLLMTLPGIALFYGGLLRAKNVLSLMTQVMVAFAVVSVLWVIYGYTLAFGRGNAVVGNLHALLLRGIGLHEVTGSISTLVHVAFQGSFACITVALVTGALAERARFSAVLIFAALWFSLSYVPLAHMVWGGGWLAADGALDFAGGTVVHINAAVAGLLGARLLGRRSGYGRESFKPHSVPMVFLGTSILYIGWFGFNAGSAGAANDIAALAFINTMIATAAAILSWVLAEWGLRGNPSLLGACSGCIAGLVAVTPAAGSVGVGGALLLGLIAGAAGLWGVVVLKRWLRTDDACDVFGVHGVCGIVGCLATGVLSAAPLGGTGYASGVTMGHQLWVQMLSVLVCVIWSAAAALIAYKAADLCVGLRVSEDQEREGLDVTSHGENAYNR
ncbi:ammonium transporter AmtB [Edwardsiella ictaluri]|nr:ammonium transporter AmtB [Edwardsiella ictaluri]AVZ81332.1 ammonium transporter AmtB [Edwardsiella ictaluri]EKS7762562.1 ammonium transporter AmtB [Edwardsiella ictaluri]EKS7769264.1 ammonium transporter AmtB [Edwardsiella ictaluri]EKS7772413.1 ammonium transporter AmtB [Edwardsiella ictaluri]EKS7775937.1 ammonium transporter AmtB [Edwardsiella ictaluri]